MNETENKQSKWGTIGLVLLIAALFVAIKLIFAGLDAMMPDPEPLKYTGISDKSGQYSGYSVRVLDDEARQSKDVALWLEDAQEQLSEGGANQAFWLYRQDMDEYVLYLPEQDRTLTEKDLTAVEEGDEDGEITLVLRSRTGEKSEDIAPEEQILGIVTESKQWKGIRVKIIVDGREQEVHKLVSQGSRLYTTEEVYIGRDV